MIVTAGSHYSTIFTPETLSHIKTPNVEVATQWVLAMLLRVLLSPQFLKGKSLSESHHDAVNRAAFVCTKSGAWVTE